MKINKFIIGSHAKTIGLFPTLMGYGYLSHFEGNGIQGAIPCFDYEEPILYKFFHALFISRELKRSGYSVYVYPYCLRVVSQIVRQFILKYKEKKNVNRLWKK